MQVTPAFITCMAAVLCLFTGAARAETPSGEGVRYIVEAGAGRRAVSPDVIGAILEVADGRGGPILIRADAETSAVAPASARKGFWARLAPRGR